MPYLRRNRQTRKETLNATNLVYQGDSISESAASHVVVFTDGATKLSPGQRETFGFSGWGCYVTSPGNALVEDQELFGPLEAKDSESAELEAVIQGLDAISTPSNVLLVTDCAYIIKGLNRAFSGNSFGPDAEPVLQVDTNSQKRSDRWETLREHVLENTNICSIHSQWVPAHTMDDSLVDNQPSSLDEFLRQGNKVADAAANKGAAQSVRKAWSVIQGLPEGMRKEHALALSKAVKHSGFVEKTSIEFIKANAADLPVDIFTGMPKHIVSAYRKYHMPGNHQPKIDIVAPSKAQKNCA